MKQSEVTGRLMAGVLGGVMEFRHASADVIRFQRDGRSGELHKVKWRFEVGDQAFELSQNLPEGQKATDWKCPVAKGQMCLVGLRLRSASAGTSYVDVASVEPIEK